MIIIYNVKYNSNSEIDLLHIIMIFCTNIKVNICQMAYLLSLRIISIKTV